MSPLIPLEINYIHTCYWKKVVCLPQLSKKFLLDKAEQLSVMRIPFNCKSSKKNVMQYYLSKPQGRWL